MTQKKKTAKAVKKKPAKAAKKKAAEHTALDTVYILDNSNNAVTLELILGAPGQTGLSHIMLDNVHLVTGHEGSVPEFAVGTSKKLNGQTLYITTIITDTSKDTNYCETIIRLRGGKRFNEYVLNKTVPEEGDTAVFTSVIEFFVA